MDTRTIGPIRDARAPPADGAGAPAVSMLAFDEPLSLDRPQAFRHRFDRHPLMQLDAIERLAGRLLPTFQCRFMTPSTDPSIPFEHTARPPDGRSLAQVFARIEEPGSWIALYDVQTVPEYRAFVREVMAQARPAMPAGDRVLDVRGFLFLSAPPSVTPYHIDGENNFWMQIHGRKTIHLWDRHDPAVVGDEALERFILYRSLDDVRLDEARRARGVAHDCGPGDGWYFPSTTPHMTVSTPVATQAASGAGGVTMSMGVVFYTRRTVRDAHVHAMNQALRRCGLSPRRPGISAWRDLAKAPFGRLALAAATRWRGYTPTASFLRDAPRG